MRSGTAHNLYEVPILLSRVGITLDVTDNFRICLCSSIKAKRSLDVLILQVAVDRLRATDNLNACVLSCHILSEYCSVCIGVVTADDNDSIEPVLLSYFLNDSELLFCLELCSAGTDDIESARVPVRVDEVIRKLYIGIIEKSGRAALESEEDIVLVCCLKSIIKTGDNIVSAGSLSA